ncbi:MAG: hypothetical protein H7Z72_07130 [Bacteroidetes bacterium]|nr:hypothetical protein [Fibrella sp.]
MESNSAVTVCITDPIPSPPGDCTVIQHRALQNEVTNKCKNGSRSCRGLTDCAVMLQNIQKNWDCAVARETVANTCFRGGDPGHRTAITEALNAAAYCEQRYQQLCRSRTQPQPAPQPVPESDSEFMRRMAELTGLTGTALLIYIIISEGSRLFPPRNLIPIP